MYEFNFNLTIVATIPSGDKDLSSIEICLSKGLISKLERILEFRGEDYKSISYGRLIEQLVDEEYDRIKELSSPNCVIKNFYVKDENLTFDSNQNICELKESKQSNFDFINEGEVNKSFQKSDTERNDPLSNEYKMRNRENLDVFGNLFSQAIHELNK